MLTPLDIHNKEFKRSFRGYNEDEIDDFLDQVVNDYEKLFRENDNLKEELSRMKKDNAQYQKLENNLKETLLIAQKTANEVTDTAKQHAENLRESTAKECQNMRRDAEISRARWSRLLTIRSSRLRSSTAASSRPSRSSSTRSRPRSSRSSPCSTMPSTACRASRALSRSRRRRPRHLPHRMLHRSRALPQQMAPCRKAERRMALALFALILAVDQLTKYAISTVFLPGESLPVVPHIFHITYVLNPGAAFGMLPQARWFFILAAAALILAFLAYHRRLKKEPAAFYYGCVAMLAGAVGNLVDRIRQGLVIDFFDFRIWPVFNVADIAIVLGVAGMIFAILFRMNERE